MKTDVRLSTKFLTAQGAHQVGVLVALAGEAPARGAATSRVSTTCIGFGAEFNEDLLRDMAAAGGANYWYVERDDQMSGIFDEEIEGLVALAAQNLEVEIALAHSAVAGVSFLQSYPVTRTAQGDFRVVLGDLYATSPRSIGLVFHVNDVGALGETRIAEVRVTADVVQPDGIAREKLVMPVVANTDGADHVGPTVERTFVRFEAARAGEEAVRRADAGDLGGAAEALEHVSATLSPYRAEPGVAEEMQDLFACLRKMSRRRPDPKP